MLRNFTLVIAFLPCFFKAISQDVIIRDIHAKLEVSREGTLRVNETIKVNFPSPKHGIYRTIPYKFVSDGKDYETEISDVKVDGYGFQTNRRKGLFELKIGSKKKTIEGDQVYNISYLVDGPYILSDEFSELYWNVTGNEWPSSIEKASFEVILPDSLQVRYSDLRIFTGVSGSNDKNATITQRGNTIYGETTSPLEIGQGLTLAIKLPKNYIDRAHVLNLSKVREEKAVESKRKSTAYFYFPLLFLGGLLAFWRKLRENKGAEVVADQYYPPQGFSPAEVGGYYDNVVHDSDVVSLFPYWAEAGFIKIRMTDEKGLCFEKIKEIDDLRPAYEIQFFNEVFKDKSLIFVDDLKHELHDEFTTVQSKIRTTLIERDLYDSTYNDWFKSYRIPLVGLILILLGIATLVLGYIVAGMLFIVVGVIAFVLLAFHSPPSSNGIEVKEKLRGLYQFLKNPDQTKVQELLSKDAKYFEMLFPFAVAFGLDKRFSEQFASQDRRAPTWYETQRGGIFIPATIGNMSSDFSPKSISSAFSSPPASSSSSSGGGFSGGSSGGGFGGGGGGSW